MEPIAKPAPTPIALIRIPDTGQPAPTVQRLHFELSRKLYDYHVFLVVDKSIESLQIECYQSQYSERQFKNLQLKINNILTKDNNKIDE